MQAISDLATSIVLLGFDGDSKPHAARFEQRYQAAALRAAGLMGLKAVTVGVDAEVQKAASELPHGKIFATGRGLVPLVKKTLFDKLWSLVGTERELNAKEPPAAEAKTEDKEPPALEAQPAKDPVGTKPEAQPTDPWSDIKVGSLVLGKSPDPDEGWYEAHVVSMAPETDELTLRFRDYPTEPKVVAKRTAVGLMPRC